MKAPKIFLVLFIVGIVGIVGWKFVYPILTDKFQAKTSDASATKGLIRVGVDNWVGYFPLCSKNMKNRMRNAGYAFECVDDKANYEERMEKLKDKDLQFAVATVDSYLLNGRKENFPGTIVTVIDESKGGDAVVANKKKIGSINDIKNMEDVRIAFTPSSPSEHLLRFVTQSFDIERLKKDQDDDWRVETDGSPAALDKLKTGKVDVAVLWEPDVSKALENKDFFKVLGTEDMTNIIVDILLVERGFSAKNPDAVQVVLSNYYRTLKYYRTNPEKLEQDLKQETKQSKKEVEAMLKGVEWFTLHDNASKWFGVDNKTGFREVHLADVIDGTVDIFLESTDFTENPIHNNDPLVLINSIFVEKLFNKGLSFGINGSNQKEDDEFEFFPLAEDRWEELREVGTLKIQPVTFQSGTADLDVMGESELEKAVKNLKHYPKFRVYVKGHTGLMGDKAANKKLSDDRANTVRDYLIKTLDVNPNRIRSKGFGSDKPLKRKPGESYRAYKYRLPRVELILVDEVY